MYLNEINYDALAARLNAVKKPYIPFGMGKTNYTPEICRQMADKLADFCANHNIKIADVKEMPKTLEELLNGTVSRWVHFPISVKISSMNKEILEYLRKNEMVRQTLLAKNK